MAYIAIVSAVFVLDARVEEVKVMKMISQFKTGDNFLHLKLGVVQKNDFTEVFKVVNGKLIRYTVIPTELVEVLD